jgi:hypothetical protein
MPIEPLKTMEIQNGLDNTMGQYPMGLGDTIEPARVVGESISLYDLERRLWFLESRMLEHFQGLAFEIGRMQERLDTPWYRRLWDWIRARLRRH